MKFLARARWWWDHNIIAINVSTENDLPLQKLHEVSSGDTGHNVADTVGARSRSDGDDGIVAQSRAHPPTQSQRLSHIVYTG